MNKSDRERQTLCDLTHTYNFRNKMNQGGGRLGSRQGHLLQAPQAAVGEAQGRTETAPPGRPGSSSVDSGASDSSSAAERPPGACSWAQSWSSRACGWGAEGRAAQDQPVGAPPPGTSLGASGLHGASLAPDVPRALRASDSSLSSGGRWRTLCPLHGKSKNERTLVGRGKVSASPGQ